MRRKSASGPWQPRRPAGNRGRFLGYCGSGIPRNRDVPAAQDPDETMFV